MKKPVPSLLKKQNDVLLKPNDYFEQGTGYFNETALKVKMKG